ncbi:DUF6916 family protein [Nitrobacter winogradskyi]|uniref:Uncharacterized protein n=2 Tax=Nitrobacter winogradskyi TaxID=913 RepID=A0ACC6AKA7_NITWI|nr:hypothetical protein [Nitrobacter winogradskyi]MCP1999410.1 hypothetical protein [Nitrobacter winogradskyi]GEC14408.1 hypothetical protein NWI01_03000 [Nitrobacter winogradskyi]
MSMAEQGRGGLYRMQLITLERFAGCLGEGFDVDLGTASIALTLSEARRLPPQGFAAAMREPFSLLFRSGSPVVLPQKIYRMTNATVGAIEIFIVPVARDRDGIVYQAIFN